MEKTKFKFSICPECGEERNCMLDDDGEIERCAECEKELIYDLKH